MQNDFSELDDLEMELNEIADIDAAIMSKVVVPTTEMDIEYENPHNLRPNPWNPNNVDPINQTKLENSIRKDGIKRPIVVRQLDNGDYQIIGGQHRTEAAIELKMALVPIINRGKISDAEAKKETLLDNYRYGTDNLDRLSELLSDPDIGDAEELLRTMPIDEEELAEYFSHLTSVNVDLEIDDELADKDDDKDDEDETIDLSSGKPVRTHQIIRFRVSMEDSAKLAELVKVIKSQEGFTESDDLTNDGDALIYLLRGDFS